MYVEFASMKLGDREIEVVSHNNIKNDSFDVVYVHLHQNEVAAYNVGQRHVFEHGGRLISLQASDPSMPERAISFPVGGEEYSFDPNRIFSANGIEKTLALYNSNYSGQREVFKAVESFASELKGYIFPGDFVIALHNNKGQGYTMANYFEDGDHSAEVVEYYKSDKYDVTDFLLTTSEKIFNHAVECDISVVLSRYDDSLDDGSLSVYSYNVDVPYVNVEALLSHYPEQKEMLATFEDNMCSSYVLV